MDLYENFSPDEIKILQSVAEKDLFPTFPVSLENEIIYENTLKPLLDLKFLF